MKLQASHSQTKLDKAMNPEQFNQIVEAILSGKYSWACVLILRFAGYNPLHYIPYRTYNRLMKENGRERSNSLSNDQEKSSAEESSKRYSSKISDLSYLEGVGEQNLEVRGGTGFQWLSKKSLSELL